jgi:hypothetical protein
MASKVLRAAEEYATLRGDREEFLCQYRKLREGMGIAPAAVDALIMLYGEDAVPVALSLYYP